MNTRTTLIVVLLMIVGATLAGVLLWNRLPDPMASHWNVNDQVDGYTSKFWGVFMLPLMTLGMLVLFLIIPNISPYLQGNLHYPRDKIGLLYLMGGSVGFVVMRLIGKMVDRRGAVAVGAYGTVFMTVTMGLMFLTEPPTMATSALPGSRCRIGEAVASPYWTSELPVFATLGRRTNPRYGCTTS